MPNGKQEILGYFEGLPYSLPLDPEEAGYGTGRFFVWGEFYEIIKVLEKQKSQDFAKYLNAFIDISKTKSFETFVYDTRSKFQMPKEGFNPATDYGIRKPLGWKPTDEDFAEFTNTIKDFCHKFNLFYFYWGKVVEEIVFYNAVEDRHFIEFLTPHLLYVGESKTDRLENLWADLNEQKDNNFPVVIRVSQYATKRDILDFIDKHYTSEIEPIQRQFKEANVKIGKSRKKKNPTQELYDFINKNNSLSLSELQKALKIRFTKFYTQSEISKLKSIVKVRRNK